ncbi:uncharacterized protein B0H18DRAFT_141612 [Fomitopsis serialis]|nr:uncharacterized protein B0H18DRAFT_141612 [Neoantrodia serialis]KAH9914138.1 hypothetical protein B0H18DRAFT_141612 [Neoantrodia serialis]
MLPVPSKLQTSGSGDNLNGNNAHIVTSDGAGDGNTSEAHSTNGDRYNDLRSLGSNNPERAHARPRVSSHPSLEKINEDEDEDDRGHPGGAHGQRASGSFPDDAHAGSDDAPSEASQPGLRRSVKRIHQQDFEEEEFAYGTQSKRYKLDGQGLADDLAARYSRGPTPDVRGYIAPEDYERGVPDPRAHSQQPDRPYSRMSEAHVHPQAQPAPLDPTGRGEALYKLMGQDLGEFVEGHVDAYEEAKKRWSECSMEEWTAGADELTTKFSKMLDFVKDHMTAKLSLYASLHSAVASHKSTLGEREKALVEARESLVREGGAVVGGGAVASAMQAEKPNGED